MRPPDELLESLVARCLEAGESGYRDELERQCAAAPELAPELRARVAGLEDLGMIGPSSRPSSGARVPDVVGGYRLEGLLGRGGMGMVFRARKPGGDEVAVKILRPDLWADERARERFRRETLAASRLHHPGICPILEVGIDDQVPWLAMPVLHGRTLGAWLRERRPARAEVLTMLAEHARILDTAHRAGLVHRDVTPGNLFVTDDGRAIVLDFGLARDTTGEVVSMTGSHEQLGTLPYMAPEQLRGQRIDRRTDVYALGVVLYEALAGALPFRSRLRSDITRLILAGDAPALRRRAKAVPRALARVVHAAMDPDPARRHATAEELAEDLLRARDGRPVSARGLGVALRLRRWSGHHPAAATAMLLLGLLLGVASVLVLWLADANLRHHAAEQALASRSLEQADPLRAIERAVEAHETSASPQTLGQLNRLLHHVHVLATVAVQPGLVRRLVVHRHDARFDRIAAVSDAGLSLVRLDRDDGTLVEEQQLPAPAGVRLGCVRFSPDGRWLAYGGTGKAAFVVATGGASPVQLGGANGEILGVEVADDGTVFGADATGRLLRWDRGGDPGTPAVLCDFERDPPYPDHGRYLRGVRRGPGGDLLVWNRHFALRLRRDGSEVWRAAPVGKTEDTATVVMDGERGRVLLVQVGRLRLLDWASGAEQWLPKLSSPATDAVLTPSGRVVSLHRDGMVRIWDGGQRPMAQFHDPGDQVMALAGSNTADGFLAIGAGGTRRWIDMTGRIEWSMGGGDIERLGQGVFAWSSDGSLLVASGGPGRLRSWDFGGSRGAPQVRLVASAPLAVQAGPDRRSLVIATEDRSLWSWPLAGKPKWLGELPMDVQSRAGDPATGRLAFGGSHRQGKRVAILDPGAAEPRVPFFLPVEDQYGVVGLAFVPGDRLLVGCGDNRWQASRLQWLAAAGEGASAATAMQRNQEIPATLGHLTCLDAAADGRRVAFGCMEGGLHVWAAPADGGEPRPWATAPTTGRVWSIDMAADGRFVVAGIEDGSVLAWEPDRGPPVALTEVRDRPARCVLADDHRTVIEFAADGQVRMWDCANRPAVLLLEAAVGNGAVVRDAVLLAPDRDGGPPRFATVSTDGWARVWSLDATGVLARARARLQAIRPK